MTGLLFAALFMGIGGSLPDAKLTPGDVLPVTRAQVCTAGYARGVRDVPVRVKHRVYGEYGVRYVRGGYEVDHLISLELGGSNSIRNLWPESYSIVWNAHVKDRLEDRLHALVCRGTISLAEAQREIASDWIASYRKHIGAR